MPSPDFGCSAVASDAGFCTSEAKDREKSQQVEPLGSVAFCGILWHSVAAGSLIVVLLQPDLIKA